MSTFVTKEEFVATMQAFVKDLGIMADNQSMLAVELDKMDVALAALTEIVQKRFEIQPAEIDAIRERIRGLKEKMYKAAQEQAQKSAEEPPAEIKNNESGYPEGAFEFGGDLRK